MVVKTLFSVLIVIVTLGHHGKNVVYNHSAMNSYLHVESPHYIFKLCIDDSISLFHTETTRTFYAQNVKKKIPVLRMTLVY